MASMTRPRRGELKGLDATSSCARFGRAAQHLRIQRGSVNCATVDTKLRCWMAKFLRISSRSWNASVPQKPRTGGVRDVSIGMRESGATATGLLGMQGWLARAA